jgi:uncharacterized membrane protein (UPF0182 family)
MKTGVKVLIFIGAVVLIIIGLFIGTRIWLNYNWFGKLGYLHVYTKILWTRVGLWFSFFFIFLLFSGFNVLTAFRKGNIQSMKIQQAGVPVEISRTVGVVLALVGIFILGLIMAGRGATRWEMILKLLNRAKFNTVDPAFGRDISFYTFVLPFYISIKSWAQGTIVLTFIVVGFLYLLSGNVTLDQNNFLMSNQAKRHLIFLLFLFTLTLAWNYWLKVYQLVFSTRGLIYGAGFVDLKVQRYSFYVMILVTLIVAGIILSGMKKLSFKQPLIGFASLIGAAILITGIIPAVVQQLVVKPNELVKELPYIENNINLTQKAYNLDTIERKPFPVNPSLTSGDFTPEAGITKHIRLWDHRPLKSTFSQLQEFRLYYDFNDVDVDRYHFGDDYRQVMLSGREINYNQIPAEAQTWLNEKLQFTHGYGIVMTPVNEIGPEGLPQLIVKDIPPKESVPLKLERPEIYYGELTSDYVIGNTNLKELDYPRGDTNATTQYQGPGGLPIKNSLRKLLFTIHLRDLEIIFTRYLKPDSRVMLYRSIQERVPKIAPFLRLDRDPYLVVDGGRLIWIMDGYTITDRYPYSSPYQRMTNQPAQAQDVQFDVGFIGPTSAQPRRFNGNYIRNSVKITVDAYTGDVKFYVIDRKDPLIQTYMNIFPDMFVDFSEMPDSLKQHIRYPMEIFKIQSYMYSIYHMTDPQVFYNKEDKWTIPREIYGETETNMIPYYIVVKFPDEDGHEEFSLILPFTPTNKNNMLAWIAAMCDGENYGKMIEYKFPKEKLVFGPLQIESRIDQNSEISQLFTLWGQKGSSVIRGNLLVIPIKDSLIYVEPVYLRAEQSELPELKRVIVGYQDNIEMGLTLDEALFRLFGQYQPTAAAKTKPETAAQGLPPVVDLIKEAIDLYDSAQEQLRAGDFAGYGRLNRQLKGVLDKLEKGLKEQE